jgi:hypothetical protein
MIRTLACLLVILLPAVALAADDDRFVVLPLDQVTLTDGKWATEPDAEGRGRRGGFAASEAFAPYAVLTGGGEVYVVGNSPDRWQRMEERLPEHFTIAIRVARGAAIAGRVMMAKADGSGMDALGFTVPAAAAGDEAGFLRLKAQHHRSQLERGIPGAAWFRHQLTAAGGTVVAQRPAWQRDSEFDDTFDLFSGNRALSENLQLDRELGVAEPVPEEAEGALKAGDGEIAITMGAKDTLTTVAKRHGTTVVWLIKRNDLKDGVPEPGATLIVPAPADGSLPPGAVLAGTVKAKAPDVALADLTGITVREYDWSAKTKGLTPALDPLAAVVPADQHALFFSSFAAMTAVLDALDGAGTPVLQVFEPQSSDARTKERYQRQLCLEMSELSRRFGPQLVASVAFTGGDAYLRSGSDVAVLFEAKQPEVLLAFLAAKLQAATADAAGGAKALAGTVGALAWRGAVSPDRAVCAYLARVGAGTVVVTNSLAQLARLDAVAAGRESALDTTGEYRFFRDRYPLAAGDGGLLVLSDATIRRWCSPRWRIGESRRVRAAAALGELQARAVAGLVSGAAALPAQHGGLGRLSTTAGVVASEAYGTLGFMTPVGELAIERVSKAEADAYARFRDRYQHRWSAWFDPIALQLLPQAQGIAADLTVMPLISDSEYRQVIEFTRGGKIAPQAGDPHPGTLLHVAVALDPASRPLREVGGMLTGMNRKFEVDPFAWLGGSLALYADADPFWDEVAKAPEAERFLEKNFWRAPVALQAEVKDGLKLAAFLTVLRGFAEQSAPGLTVWENRTWKDQPYLRVGPSDEAAEQNRDIGKAALYYAATPSALLVTLNEEVLKRALDRRAERKQAKADGKEAPLATPWLGDHLGLRVERGIGMLVRSFERLDGGAGGRLQLLSWANLPILNEWRRLFPQEDPVALHERLWQVRLACPGGGRYVWNERFQTMESTVYGCPAAPRQGGDLPELVERLRPSGAGLTFEEQGLRARLTLSWDAAPAKPAP